MGKAHRVESGVSYCGTCYKRCFKSKLCPGCGMFKRLLASNAEAKCQECVSAAPCVRCARVGRPVSKMTDDGPVCNSCYPYFRESVICESCHEPSRRAWRVESKAGVKLVCHKCARADWRTCSQCSFHRDGSERPDGTWICKKCEALGEVPCPSCSKPMPAGRGSRCIDCYWVARGRLEGGQLVELLAKPRTRQAFQDYLQWAMSEIHLPRLVPTLEKQVVFFQRLEPHGEQIWSEQLLLREFGTAGLRKYELPVRWLGVTGVAEVSAEAKIENAERGRALALVQQAPPGSLARALLEEFYETLNAKVLAKKTLPRSMRMALRPAVSTLAMTEPAWQKMPDQKAIDKMLSDAPGQLAASSTFRGFLKKRHGIVLTARPVTRRDSSAQRKQMGEQLAAMAREPLRDERFEDRWLMLSLCFSHRVSRTFAKALLKSGLLSREDGGYNLVAESDTYWIPGPPELAFGAAKSRTASQPVERSS